MAGDKKATRHFLQQRITALAMIPLAVFLIAVLFAHIGAPHNVARAFFAKPLPALLLLAFVISAIWHARLGMQDIIADYVHSPPRKKLALLLNTLFTFALGLIALLAILKIVLM